MVDKKSKEKEIKDIPQVGDYVDMFNEDLPRIPKFNKLSSKSTLFQEQHM